KLRELMDVDSAETRYGAFRALTTLDKNEPFVRGEMLGKQFRLHPLKSDGPPMVHITNWKKAEVVLFGADQEIKTPIFARAGNNIIVSATPGSDKVTVCKFEVGHEDQRKTVSTRVRDVIRAMTDFGATFPDVNQFLVEADHQQNLAGRLEIDALPRAGRSYEPPDQGIAGKSKHKNPIGNADDGPNMFAFGQDKKAKKKAEDEEESSKDEASQADAVSKKSKSADADDDKPASGTASKSSASTAASGDASQSIKQASQTDASGSKNAVKTANHETDDDATPTNSPPPPSRWSFWRLFKFGGGDVSGNQEP
ncbi:MAG TPA: hypothetical protein VFG04_05150, partial [Planctomycetaceae bacterium]|nr:hypothetical protein [Planctomycetaceae bacterium]